MVIIIYLYKKYSEISICGFEHKSGLNYFIDLLKSLVENCNENKQHITEPIPMDTVIVKHLKGA